MSMTTMNSDEGTIDLTQLEVTDLDVKTGVGTTTLRLLREGQVRAHLSSGVGNTTIRAPMLTDLRGHDMARRTYV
jgi:hypothetical protein